MKKEYGKKELAEFLGVNPETILYYTKLGIITPEIDNPKGRGVRRKYSLKNVVEFMVVLRLRKGLVPLEKIKLILQKAAEKGGGKYLNPLDPMWKINDLDDIGGDYGPFLTIYDINDSDDPKVRITKTERTDGGGSWETKIVVNLDLIFGKAMGN